MTQQPLTDHARASEVPARTQRLRRYLMCPPTYFDVTYSINPWMDPRVPTSARRAMRQWTRLRQVFLDLGHDVALVDPVPGLPDMVFAANAGIVIGEEALVARFRHRERRPESAAYLTWFRDRGYVTSRKAAKVNEGEGDYLVAGRRILAGSGFRSSTDAQREVEQLFGLPVVGLTLVDPHYYHLDTALTVLDDDEVAYYPAAFSAESRAVLSELYPDAVIAHEDDAAALGLNAVSDGLNVVLPAAATRLAAALAERGFRPIGVDLSELLKSGGGPKCCTLELRADGASAPTGQPAETALGTDRVAS
jgi:N-dimethylarginine dimethylaminohydrolase